MPGMRLGSWPNLQRQWFDLLAYRRPKRSRIIGLGFPAQMTDLVDWIDATVPLVIGHEIKISSSPSM
ncbi:hypothetical protein I7I50_03094 [Histoplasma capsulatum G186AR]|uniref:Uncharacterized protein n=1 Tax=Ajellomyces capsulatus TaxID=5037 RepID=A0A8H7Z1S3_AJECA|nr:hypothetical protein I7I52_00240 [Histoplasma capsulatum]QSS72041.1 hypothetical protein I7I50_03094 [Histoplasma capsulatum G186AR]